MTTTAQQQTTTTGLALSHSRFSKPPVHIPNARGEIFRTELVEIASDERHIKINWWAEGATDDRARPHSHPFEFLTRAQAAGHPCINGLRRDPAIQDAAGEGEGIEAMTRILTGEDIAEMDGYRGHGFDLAGVSFISRIITGRLVHEVWSLEDHVSLGSPGEQLLRWTSRVETIEAGQVYVSRRREYHAVLEVAKGTATRIICGPRTKNWGYLDPKSGTTSIAGRDPLHMERLWMANPSLRP